MNTTSRSRVDTKQNLILSALHLFAEQGVDAVSMRTINSVAGARNASAVHYHFGSKLGIIEAVIDLVKGAVDKHRLPALAALEAEVTAGVRPAARDVVHVLFDAYVRMNRESDHGRAAVRFLARLQTDMSPEIQRLLNRDDQDVARRFDALLALALPELPDAIRRTRYVYTWSLMVHGFAATGSWNETAFGDLSAPTSDAALVRFLDYLVGGLEAPVAHP